MGAAPEPHTKGSRSWKKISLSYNRELGRKGNTRWGVEVAANYLNVGFDDSGSFGVGTKRTTDTYPFTPGTTPPLPGYNGTFGGPGFVLGDTPVSSRTRFVANGATVTGHREFDADVWGFRLGQRQQRDRPCQHEEDAPRDEQDQGFHGSGAEA